MQVLGCFQDERFLCGSWTGIVTVVQRDVGKACASSRSAMLKHVSQLLQSFGVELVDVVEDWHGFLKDLAVDLKQSHDLWSWLGGPTGWFVVIQLICSPCGKYVRPIRMIAEFMTFASTRQSQLSSLVSWIEFVVIVLQFFSRHPKNSS
jgi:hypothetical protein